MVHMDLVGGKLETSSGNINRVFRNMIKWDKIIEPYALNRRVWKNINALT